MKRYLPVICILLGLATVATAFTISPPPLYEKGLLRELKSEPMAKLAFCGAVLTFAGCVGGAWQVARWLIRKNNSN